MPYYEVTITVSLEADSKIDAAKIVSENLTSYERITSVKEY